MYQLFEVSHKIKSGNWHTKRDQKRFFCLAIRYLVYTLKFDYFKFALCRIYLGNHFLQKIVSLLGFELENSN